jgi:hypothetical protein
LVRYKNHAEGYIELINQGDNNLSNYTLKTNEGESFSTKILEGKLLFNKLQLDKTYTLYVTDNCEQEIAIAAVETTINNQNYVKVSSQKMFDAVNEWASTKEGNGVGLHRYVLGLEAINRNEKLSFLQDYYLNDNPYPDDVTDETIIESIDEVEALIVEDCNCKILELTTKGVITPGNVNLKTANIVEGVNIPRQGYFKKSWKSYWSYNSKSTGPAKKVLLHGQQQGCGGSQNQTFGTQAGNGNAGTPLLAQIQYSLICVGAQQKPGNCDCEKTVNVAYRYDTAVKTNANTYDGWCKQKDAFASAEDWAVLLTEDANGYKVSNVEGVLARAKCSSQVNPEFIIAVGAMAFAVAGTIATGGAAAPLLVTLEPMFNKAVNTEVYTVNDCKSETFKKTLLNDKTSISLKPGTIASARLFSFDAVSIGGYNSFRNEAGINSSFYLATMIPGGKGGSLAGCCMAPKADWISYSMEGPVSNSELINHVDYFLGINGLKATTNAGTIVGDHVQNCGFIDGIRIKD